MFSNLIVQWKYDWQNRRILFWLELFGTISSIGASFCISLFQNHINIFWVFLLWLLGSISMGICAYLRNIGWPMLIMSIYTIFNLIGMYKAL